MKHFNLFIFISFYPLIISSESVDRFWKAENETLKELDLQTIEGKWFCMYQRKQLDPNVECHEINLNVTDNRTSIDVSLEFESWEGHVTNNFDLVQDKYLKGKLEGVQWIQENFRISYTWFIIQALPNLIVFQITGQEEKLTENWLIYSRNKIGNSSSESSLKVIEKGSKLLKKVGAYPDFNGTIGYKCQTKIFDHLDQID